MDQSNVNEPQLTIENVSVEHQRSDDETIISNAEIKVEEDINPEIFYFTTSSDSFESVVNNDEEIERMDDTNGSVSIPESSFSIPFTDEQMNQLLLVNAANMSAQDDGGKMAIEMNSLLKMQMPELKDEIGNTTSHFVKYKADANGKNVKIWECGICHKEFGHQYILMRHLPTHTDERKFQCKQCGKAFRQMSTLSQHRAIHSKLRPYVCEVCQKTFNRVSTLISHRKTHTGMKPHRCHLCNKAFHQKGNLRNHIFTHTNERPYKCDVCQKGFNQMSNLMCHKFKAHHRADKPKYNCPTCGKEFERRIGLRNHEQYEHGEASHTSNTFTPSASCSSVTTKPSVNVKYTNGVLVSQINTSAMRHAMTINQVPFALLRPIDGIPVLVRVLPAGDKQMLVPATADDLKKYGEITLKEQDMQYCESCQDSIEERKHDPSSQNGSTVLIRIPVVASVVQRRRNGGVHMDIESPGPKKEQNVDSDSDDGAADNMYDDADDDKLRSDANMFDIHEAVTSPVEQPDVIDVDGSSVQMFDSAEIDLDISGPLINLEQEKGFEYIANNVYSIEDNDDEQNVEPNIIEIEDRSKDASIVE